MRFTEPRIDAGRVLTSAVALFALAAPGSQATADVSTRSGPGGDLGDRVTTYALRPLAGEGALTIADLEGEVVVVNFWATWCKPCRYELPVLDALHAAIVPRGGRVVAIAIDRDAGRVQEFVSEQALGLPVYHDGPDGLVATLDLEHFPFTLVFDRAGKLAYTTHETDAEALAALEARVDALVSDPLRMAEGGEK